MPGEVELQNPISSGSGLLDHGSWVIEQNWQGWLLVVFLIPVTLMMHDFWSIKDPMMAQMQMVMLMKNVSMLGGALFISQVGPGELSFDSQRQAR